MKNTSIKHLQKQSQNGIFLHNGREIPYTVSFDRYKSVRLYVKSPNIAEVRLPFHVPFSYAEIIIAKHINWILERQEKFRQFKDEVDGFLPAIKPITEEIYIFGLVFRVSAHAFPIRRQEKLFFTARNTYFSQEKIFENALPVLQNSHKDICLIKNTLFVQSKSDEESLKRILSWRKKTAQFFLAYYYAELWKIFQEKITRFLLQHTIVSQFHKILPQLNVRTCKRCFGSCKINRRTGEAYIMLSVHLMGLPLEYIEFVILHEFCHLIFPNHSPDFYRLFDLVLPAHKAMRAAVNSWSKTHNSV